jgi:uncharacterized protein YciI
MQREGLNERELDSYHRHAAYLKRMVAEGVEIFVGRTRNADAAGWALGVIKADSEEAARTIMNEDPFVADGVVTAELFEFDIIMIEPQNA